MKRETLDLIGSGLLLLALVTATIATLAPTPGASVASSNGADALVERGEMLFYAKGCATCHGIAGISDGGIGPDLTSLDTRAATQRPGLTAEAYVHESLRDPDAFIAAASTTEMPDVGLTDADIEALTAFLLQPDGE